MSISVASFEKIHENANLVKKKETYQDRLEKRKPKKKISKSGE